MALLEPGKRNRKLVQDNYCLKKMYKYIYALRLSIGKKLIMHTQWQRKGVEAFQKCYFNRNNQRIWFAPLLDVAMPHTAHSIHPKRPEIKN